MVYAYDEQSRLIIATLVGLFIVICMVYCLCNAFWIMVIRSAFSNRFAYLSWFLYPVVVAYPLVNLEIRDDQDSFTGRILLAYAAFSSFMWFVFW